MPLCGIPRVHVVGELAVLDERSRVDETLEALPHGELAQAPLALDPLLASHGESTIPPLFEVGQQRRPIVSFVDLGHVTPSVRTPAN